MEEFQKMAAKCTIKFITSTLILFIPTEGKYMLFRENNL